MFLIAETNKCPSSCEKCYGIYQPWERSGKLLQCTDDELKHGMRDIINKIVASCDNECISVRK